MMLGKFLITKAQIVTDNYNQYIEDMNLKENLVEKYVAYLDVLGFKELVFKKRINELETYFHTINETLIRIADSKKNVDSLLVSDSIILITSNTKDDFKMLLQAIQTIQARLAIKDIWVRGAVSFGEVYFDKDSNLIVGKGLVNAYLLEQEAKFPRVIIDPIIVPRIAQSRQEFYDSLNPKIEDFETDKLKLVHSWFNHIPEDAFFIDYSYKMILNPDGKNLYKAYALIKKNLYSDQKYYDKYLWVKKYFLDTIEDLERKFEMNMSKSQENKDYYRYLKKWFNQFLDL